MMIKKTWLKRTIAAFLIGGMLISSTQTTYAAVSRFPKVTKEMTEASYWSSRQKDGAKTLATQAQIKKLNKSILSVSETNMYNLKKVSETVDGAKLNESLKKSAESDAAYFGVNKYDAAGNKVTESYYSSMISNTQSSDTAVHQVSYGIVVKRTTLRVFPTDKAILDDPGDNDFDNLYSTGLRVNEPFVIMSSSADKKYYYGKCDCCSGWVLAEDVAICSDKEEWLDAWDNSSDETLVVYGSKIRTEASNTTLDTADRLLTMGTTLELVDRSDYPKLISNRSAYNNYVVYLPVRKADGSFEKQPALIPQSADVHEGFLKLTQKNVMMVSFKMLGSTYGWGGMLDAEDCSGYVRDVYRCFGINLPRNTTWQVASPVKKYTFMGYNAKEKMEIIKNLPAGSTLFFPGHEMIYLGAVKDRAYVISSTSSMMNPKKEGERLRVRGVVINTLDIKRANGNTWLESLVAANIPFAGEENTLYKKNYVGKGFSKAMEGTAIKSLSRKNKKLTVKWKAAGDESCIEGYQIQYTQNDDFSTAKIKTIKKKTKGSCTVNVSENEKNCKVRIRNYVTIDGKKYYSKWSKAKTSTTHAHVES